MIQGFIKSKYWITSGIILSLITCAFHFIYIQKPIFEYRLTYSVGSSDYQDYVDKLAIYSETIDGRTYSLSPNTESIADSIKSKNIRRFELRKFTLHTINNEIIHEHYFEKLLKLPIPELISAREVGSSKPIGRSLGLGLLVIAGFLFIGKIYS